MNIPEGLPAGAASRGSTRARSIRTRALTGVATLFLATAFALAGAPAATAAPESPNSGFSSCSGHGECVCPPGTQGFCIGGKKFCYDMLNPRRHGHRGDRK